MPRSRGSELLVRVCRWSGGWRDSGIEVCHSKTASDREPRRWTVAITYSCGHGGVGPFRPGASGRADRPVPGGVQSRIRDLPSRVVVYLLLLLLRAIDGTSMFVPDSPANLTRYGRQTGSHGGSGVPDAAAGRGGRVWH